MLPKIQNMIEKRQLPWIIRSKLEVAKNRYSFYENKFLHYNRRSRSKHATKETIITFKCGFHGKSGGVVAIANIANLLTSRYHVEFVSHPGSQYNTLLDKSVHIVTNPNVDSHLFICDVSCKHSFFKKIKDLNKRLIISCHGLLHSLHGLREEYVQKSLYYADLVHFVNTTQQDSFQLDEGHYVIIPNATKPINKTKITNNVGTVGNLNEERKNAKETVNIALNSNTDFIHLWGTREDEFKHPKVKTHSWESNKEKIYNSFDVLISMSKVETFGLVVIEALSAGIPCLLSNIPAFGQYKRCPGVVLCDTDHKNTVNVNELNNLLLNKNKLKKNIIEFWEKNYSEKIISEKWFEIIDLMMRRES